MKSEIHIFRRGERVSVMDEAQPARCWHVGPDGLRVYQAGVCVAVLAVDDHERVLLARKLLERVG
jgi:hypothetical protein